MTFDSQPITVPASVKDRGASADTIGMPFGETVYLASRLAASAVAAFLAIALWSRTRDIAWVLVVIGLISSYAEIVFSLLLQLGLVSDGAFSFEGLPLGKIVLANLPYVFLSIALAIMIYRKKKL